MIPEKKILLIFICLLVAKGSLSQSRRSTISGTIRDSRTGETLLGATIQIKQSLVASAVSNEYGFYSLTIPQGDYILLIQYVGYKTDTQHIALHQNITNDITLSPTGSQLDEIVVLAKKPNDNITNAGMGVARVTMSEINRLPALFGEKDLFKSIQLLPGIKSNGEGSSGLNIRGGAADQNLILLDEAPIYNASHLLGFFSVFNADAVKDVTIYKGSQPAQYGGRLSSVIELRMKEGNKQKFEVNSTIGDISSNISVEGPIIKDKASFFVSGRRTYIDQLLQFSKDQVIKNTKLFFYDLNVKSNFRVSPRDVIFLSGYFGKDILSIFGKFGVSWGNNSATLRWNHIVNSKCFSNTFFIFSDYHYSGDLQNSGNGFRLISNIRDYNFKQELQYFPSSWHSFRVGFNSIYHNITPGLVMGKDGSSQGTPTLQNRTAWENAIYTAHEWKLSSWLNLDAGLRFTSFSVLGKGDFYGLDKNREVTDTLSYTAGQFVRTYFNPEPRVSASFVLGENASIKTSYSRNTQNLHLISNSTAGNNPSDKWIPSNNNIKPEIADQVSLGYFHTLSNNRFELSIEAYYRYLQHQIDYKDEADILSNNAIETQLLEGIGRSYGLEFYVKKRVGKFTGWVSYTLSRTERRITGINNGNWYAARQDRTHDISVVSNCELSTRLNISATWVFSTGNAVTFPGGKYYIENQVVWLYAQRNGYRMPDNHRLDISATYKFINQNKHGQTEISLGLYNVYGRQNAYSLTFQDSQTHPGTTEVEQLSLFRWIPALSVTRKFK